MFFLDFCRFSWDFWDFIDLKILLFLKKIFVNFFTLFLFYFRLNCHMVTSYLQSKHSSEIGWWHFVWWHFVSMAFCPCGLWSCYTFSVIFCPVTFYALWHSLCTNNINSWTKLTKMISLSNSFDPSNWNIWF